MLSVKPLMLGVVETSTNHFHSQSHFYKDLFRSLCVRLKQKERKENTWTAVDSPVTSFCRHACLTPQQEQILVTENRKTAYSPQRLCSSYIDKWSHCSVIIIVIHSFSAMGMWHLLHYIEADTAGPGACFLVTAYYRPACDIYKYFVICRAICVMLLNCHYFSGNETQPVINWTLLRWGGSCLFMNVDFTPQINQRQIKMNYFFGTQHLQVDVILNEESGEQFVFYSVIYWC